MDVNFSSLPSLQPQSGSQGSGSAPPSTGGGAPVKTLQGSADKIVVQTSESSGPKNDGGPARQDVPKLKSAQQALDSLRFSSRRTEIGFNNELNQVFLNIIDTRTDQVVEQIPSEEFVKFVHQQLEPSERETSSESPNGAVVDEAV